MDRCILVSKPYKLIRGLYNSVDCERKEEYLEGAVITTYGNPFLNTTFKVFGFDGEEREKEVLRELE